MEEINELILQTIRTLNRYAQTIYVPNTTTFKIDLLKSILSYKMSDYLVKKYYFLDIAKLNSIGLMSDIFANAGRLQETYELFEDTESKEIFRWIVQFYIAYLFVGSYAMDIFPPKEYKSKRYNVKKTFRGYIIDDYVIHCGSEIFEIWEHEQYGLEGICEPSRKDVIISAGAFNGESSIWFADQIGPEGVVHAFEPSKNAYRRLIGNIKRNRLDSIIKPHNCGLWDSNRSLYLHRQKNDRENSCSETASGDRIDAITIDTFANENLSRVDMIKMDIEGSEYHALKGAKDTIRKYCPKLAISIYHKYSDIVQIPRLIRELDSSYKLYLSHKCFSGSEIVLFAIK